MKVCWAMPNMTVPLNYEMYRFCDMKMALYCMCPTDFDRGKCILIEGHWTNLF